MPQGGLVASLQIRHDGQISQNRSSAEIKNISLYQNSDLPYMSCQPAPPWGTFARSSRNVVWVAMDAAASGDLSPDENVAAYGEVVWSWRRDPGVYPPRLCGCGNGDKKGRSPGRARSKP